MTSNRIRVMLQTFAMPLLLACIGQRAYPNDGSVTSSSPVVLFVSHNRTVGPEAVFASGFVVKHREDLFLVTAKHRAEEFNSKTSIGIAGPLKSTWTSLAELAQLSDSGDRANSRNNQVSLIRIIADNAPKPFLSEAQRIAVNIDELMTEIPNRGTELAVVGYPVVMRQSIAARAREFPELGFAEDLRAVDASLLLTNHGDGAVTGIEVTTFVATRELQNPVGDEFNVAVFVAPRVHPQFAGSPVFVRSESGRNPCAGMYVGDIADVLNESRISAIVAARHVREEILRAVAEP